ncbi:MAG: hypothetical protein IJ087_12765 [Eggerthellaceae bacterium]|nr:hypothetical protein [Eggerthellaceae bacterium]
MPFLVCKTTSPITRAQEVELKTRFGCAIAHVPGKSEQGLLIAFEDNARLWLAGDNGPAAYIEASVFANERHAGYDALSAEIAVAMRDVLGIPPERVYVRYADIPAWSVADMVADRRMFV